jgi:hypothetical protein
MEWQRKWLSNSNFRKNRFWQTDGESPYAATSKEELRSLLEKSSQELHRKIDCHYARILACCGTAVAPRRSDGTPSGIRREDKLKAAFIETIEVLEQTRKSFKSKQIEALRRKLTQVLIDAE